MSEFYLMSTGGALWRYISIISVWDANPFGLGDASTQHHAGNDAEDGKFRENPSAAFAAFIKKLEGLGKGEGFPFTLVLSDPLSNSFVGPVPDDAAALALAAEEEDGQDCYDAYVDAGMTVEEYVRTADQDEILGLADMVTEGYQRTAAAGEHGAALDTADYGTDRPLDLPDRLRRVYHRGADHPTPGAKAPVAGDDTVMGEGSRRFAVPSVGKRGAYVGAVTDPAAAAGFF